MRTFFKTFLGLTVLVTGIALLVGTRIGGDKKLTDAGARNSTATASQISPERPIAAAPEQKNVTASPTLRQNELAPQEQLWQQPSGNLTFARFHKWAEQFSDAPAGAEKNGSIEEGIALATERRDLMQALIRNDPEQALAVAVPFRIRRALPVEVLSLIEKQVSGRGQLALLAALPEPGKEKVTAANVRTVTIAGNTYNAHVYGWRLGEPTRNDIPLHGIVLGNDMAVSANPLRLLDREEAADALAIESNHSPNAISDNELATLVAVDTGGKIKVFSSLDEALTANAELIETESGPPQPHSDPNHTEASAYTEGIKSIIMIRVDFPDLVGAPVSEATASNIVNSVDNFYTELSYGRVSFNRIGEGSEITPTFRLTNSASYYGTNDFYAKLRTDARAAATAAGYVLSSFQFDVICIGAVPGFSWAGLGYVGAPGSWIRNSFATSGGVTAHELGHNFGLNHANFWDTSGSSVIGTGVSLEYGDIFENMGSSGSIPNGHHNVRYKNYLNWLTSNEVQTVSTSGAYRITAHDNPNSTGIRGLRIVKNSSTNYWVEFRQKFTSNKWLMNGAPLRWAQNGNQKSQLLDTTPGTSDGRNDAPLVIGRTFTDKGAGIHITPLGKGGTTPESLDVRINLGTFPGNVAPTVSISASATNAATAQTLTFTASATDPNGDPLAYYWSFGDGNFGTNGPAASKSWATAGEYVVRCEVSDMKGGVGSAWLIVRVGSPTTFRISGTVTSAGIPVQGARVYASSTRMAWTDSDGKYTIVGLPAGSYSVNASLEGYVFAAIGFSNPVAVGPNANNINFLDGQGVPFITRHPSGQTNYPGGNLVLSTTAAGAEPMKYQWWFGNGPIPGATNSHYLISDAQLTNTGPYHVVITNQFGSATSLVANVTISNSAIVQALFTESFDSDSSANWIINQSSSDTSVTFNYNYANDGIPPAPHTIGGTTHGVKFKANINNAAVAAINISPSGQNFTGDYQLRFDMWINANGPFPGGGAGSTEHVTAGIGTAGNRVQWNNAGSAADGYWFAVSGEGGATATTTGIPDFAAFSGSSLLAANSTVYLAGTTSNPRDNAHPYYITNFPGGQAPPSLQRNSYSQQTGTLNQGTVGFAWRDVTVTKTGSTVEWFIDGLKIARITGAGSPSTNIFIGYCDGYSSLSDNANLSFGIVDNLRVERTVFAPVITTHVTNRTVTVGQNTTFRVSATGSSPAYQWQFNSTNIAGATSSAYTLLNIQPDKAGTYSVVVSNAAGILTSSGELNVVQPLSITAHPLPQVVFVRGNAFFSVEAEGTNPDYQWRRNGTNLAGRTSSQLLLPAVQLTDAGDYSVIITNAAGSVVSSNATLTINPWMIGGASAHLTNGQFGFTLLGAPGYSVIIDGSHDLQNWIPLKTNALTAEPLAFIDPQSSLFTNRFYRFREE